MSTTRSRRAVTRRTLKEASDSDEDDMLEEATPKKVDTRLSIASVASRVSFDDEFTPRARSKPPKSSTTKTSSGTITRGSGRKPGVLSDAPVSRRRESIISRNGHEDTITEIPIPNGTVTTNGRSKMNSSASKRLPPPVMMKIKNMDMLPMPTLPLDALKRNRQPYPSPPPEVSEAKNDFGDCVVKQLTDIPTGPKSRIVISKLVLENFKSYAGVQCIGPFHKSFSAVVGPNGSGKSNVIDSLLFVFGFRASKMRQGKISALIHNSVAHPDLGFCSVQVHFESIYEDSNPEAYEVVPDSTIVVARKAYKNNSSKYTINDRDSSFTEVTTLLKDQGIDLDHKRFLILQGEVESIAQMKPKATSDTDDGLLEYLEDIVGTSKYRSPIEGALQRMEALNEICAEKSSRVQIVEKERDRLEAKKEVAVQAVQDENELATKQSALYQLFVAECTNNLTITGDLIAEWEAELRQEAEGVSGNQSLIESLKERQVGATKSNQTLLKKLCQIQEEASRAEKQGVQVAEKQKHLISKQKKACKSNAAIAHCLSEADAWTQNHAEELLRFRQEIAVLELNLEKENAELAKIRNSLKDKTEVFSQGIEAKQKQLQPWQAQFGEIESALAIAQSEKDIILEWSAQSSRDLEAAQSQVKGYTEAQQKLNSDLASTDEELIALRSQLARAETNVTSTKEKEAQMKMSAGSARSKAEEAKASLAASQTSSSVLTSLTRLSDSGRITGFYGRLGSLGKIEAKYDIAISTACPSLDNIVVDTVDVGQACIDYLRKNNLGRAMFILLDRLPTRGLDVIETPEHVPRLFDLVQAKDPKFKAAFYSVLQNTLVAKDLDQANRIAYGKKRWRVVTLDGQLIDKSGAMSGGGTKAAKGGMSSKFASLESAGSVTKMQKECDEEEASLHGIREQVRTLEDEISKLQIDAPKLEILKSKLSLESSVLDQRRKDVKARIKELSTAGVLSSVDARKVSEIETKIESLEKTMLKLKSNTVDIEEEIRVLHEKIMDIGGIKLRAQKSKVDSLVEQISSLNDRYNLAEVAKIKAEKDSKKFGLHLEQEETELASIVRQIEDLNSEVSHGTKGSSFMSKDIERLENDIAESTTSIRLIKQELDAEMELINVFKVKELELKNKLEEHKKRHAEDTKRLGHWNDKRSRLTLQELSSYFVDGDTVIPNTLDQLTADELADLDKEELKAEIAVLEETTQNTKIETGVLEEYQRRCEELAERTKVLEDAVAERDLARSTADDLRHRRLTEFMTGFHIISQRLKEMYQMITMGGNAELELVDSLDPFSEGILFSVMPPKKSWKNISNLSGGEKTLSSLALVFALHHYKPTPLYVMDEIDAALDFRNVSIVANYIKDRTKNAQFIVISLRNNMFELSARLIGIYKTSNMTKSIAIENQEIVVA